MTKTLTEQDIAPLEQRFRTPVSEAIARQGSWYVTRPELLAFANAILSTFGGVSERDARERERAACRAGIGRTLELTRRDMMDRGGNYPAAIVDSLYPPLPPTPRTVTLSCGIEYWRECGEWVQGLKDGRTASSPPYCVTLADFELCAALLREEQGR